jgi:hypothetical protein
MYGKERQIRKRGTKIRLFATRNRRPPPQPASSSRHQLHFLECAHITQPSLRYLSRSTHGGTEEQGTRVGEAAPYTFTSQSNCALGAWHEQQLLLRRAQTPPAIESLQAARTMQPDGRTVEGAAVGQVISGSRWSDQCQSAILPDPTILSVELPEICTRPPSGTKESPRTLSYFTTQMACRAFRLTRATARRSHGHHSRPPWITGVECISPQHKTERLSPEAAEQPKDIPFRCRVAALY